MGEADTELAAIGYDAPMLGQRLFYGTLMVLALGIVLVLDHQLESASGMPMVVVFAVLLGLTARELSAIFRAKGVHCNTAMAMAGSVVGFVAMYAITFVGSSPHGVQTLVSIVLVTFLIALGGHGLWQRRIDGAATGAAATLFMLVYLGLTPGFYACLRFSRSGWVIASLILVTKFADSGAYFTGRLLGRHKLIPFLSPGKTWEGLFGGILSAAIAAVVAAWVLNQTGQAGLWQEAQWIQREFDYASAAVGGAVLGLAGQGGDLVASLLKRDAGIKDSGRLIPGFGGLLDVVDSPIGAAPVAYWLLVLAT